MLKKQLTFTDYNDEVHTEAAYFNLSKSEIGDLQFSTPGGLTAHLQHMLEVKDVPQIHSMFVEIIAKAYGEKSADGRYFRKFDADGHPLFNDFKATPAYDVLYMELITDEDSMSAFINAILPQDLNADVAANRQTIAPAN